MSQIDEAFIQAYSMPQPSMSSTSMLSGASSGASSGAPVLGDPVTVRSMGASHQLPHQLPQQVQPPLAGLQGGPHISMHAVTTQPAESQPADWAPEPIPAPHFSLPQADYHATSQTATVEASTPISTARSTPQSMAWASDEPVTQRRPLSTFSAPEQPPTTAFSPVFEVDAFRWPSIIDDLLSAHHQLLVPVADQLLVASEEGRSLIGIAGTRLGIGCTTVQMCLARIIALAGKSVALVDASFAQATLARKLGLEFDTGWEEVLTGQLPLAECVVKSLQDRMALLPLARPCAMAAELLASIQTSVTAGVLRYHYDVVLFNLGAAGQPSQLAAAQSVMRHCRLDASIIVADTAATGDRTGDRTGDTTGDTDAAQIDPLMSIFGQTCLGVIGNSAVA